jgi:hypothetical protein
MAGLRLTLPMKSSAPTPGRSPICPATAKLSSAAFTPGFGVRWPATIFWTRSTFTSGLAYTGYYTRYYYPQDGGDGGGEFSLELDIPASDAFTVSTDFYYSPSFEGVESLGSAYLGGAWAVSDKLELSGEYGIYEVDQASDEQEWDIGATYYLGEETAVDFRYYDGTEYESSYLELNLSWDTTLVGG